MKEAKNDPPTKQEEKVAQQVECASQTDDDVAMMSRASDDVVLLTYNVKSSLVSEWENGAALERVMREVRKCRLTSG